MKIAMAQMQMSSDHAVNLQKTLKYISQAAGEKADLVFFPEVQLTRFFAQYRKKDLKARIGGDKFHYTSTLDSNEIRAIRNAVRQAGIYASPNVYLYAQKGDDILGKEGHYYDASLFINPDGNIQGISKMVHVTNAPEFYEDDYYTPSEDGFRVYDTPFGKVGIVICFDRHLPESVRCCALKGAKLVIIPTANTARENMELFTQEIRVQSYQNGVFTAMCNRTGEEDGMTFAGESLVTDPWGNVIVKADNREGLITADLDLSLVDEAHENLPYLKLRRPDIYEI